MVTVGTRLARIGFLIGLLALLMSGPTLETTQAWARPVSWGGPGDGTGGTGDPTGDDLPSPTPKPTARFGGSALQSTSTGTSAYGTRGIQTSVFGRWSLYIRLLIRLGIR